jgi:hypothetical protein
MLLLWLCIHRWQIYLAILRPKHLQNTRKLQSHITIFCSMIEYAKMTNQSNTLTKCLATFWSCERKDCPDSWIVILVKSWHYSHYVYVIFMIVYIEMINLFGYLKTKTLTKHSGRLESYYYIFSMIEYANMTNLFVCHHNNTLTKCLATFWSCDEILNIIKTQH